MRTSILFCLLGLSLGACSSDSGGNKDELTGVSGEGEGEGDGEGDGSETDDDGDGFSEAQGDCDDTNPDVSPAAEEFCNDRDDNCDGAVDEPENLADGQGSTAWEDSDGDGYGNPDADGLACEFSDGWATNDLDCDDNEASANPDGFEENWNGIDENCDGQDFDLEGCLSDAMDATASEWGSGLPGHSMPDFYDTYDLTVTWPTTLTFSGAGYGEVTKQVAVITDVSHGIYPDGNDYTVSFETNLQYNSNADRFTMTVGVEPSYWDTGALGYTIADIMTYLVGLVADVPDDWDGTFSCYGYVDATPADFDGSLELIVNESRRTVSAQVQLESNVTSFTDGDASLFNLDGGQCSNDIIDALAGYLGIGTTYTFLNDNLVLVGKDLVTGYETSLEANIAEECSR